MSKKLMAGLAAGQEAAVNYSYTRSYYLPSSLFFNGKYPKLQQHMQPNFQIS
jgi:hypothetical protein